MKKNIIEPFLARRGEGVSSELIIFSSISGGGGVEGEGSELQRDIFLNVPLNLFLE